MPERQAVKKVPRQHFLRQVERAGAAERRPSVRVDVRAYDGHLVVRHRVEAHSLRQDLAQLDVVLLAPAFLAGL